MQTFLASLGFVLRRMRANWRLLSVVGLGVLVAAVLMSSTTLYTRALSDLGLSFQLQERVGDSGGLISLVERAPAGGQRAAGVRRFVEDSVDARFGELSQGRLRMGMTRAFVGDLPAFASAPNPAGGLFASIGEQDTHLRVVEGRLPDPFSPVADPALGFVRADGPIEAALPLAQLERSGLSVGETFPLIDYNDECDREPPGPPGSPPPPPTPPCTTTAGITTTFTVTIVGVVEEADPDDFVWNAFPASMGNAPSLPLVGPVFTLLVHDQTLFGAFAQTMAGHLLPTYYLDDLPVDRFDVSVVDPTQAAFDQLRADLQTVGGLTRSPVESTLDAFETDLNFTEVPILLLIVQIVAIVLFYVIIVATMLVEREESEIALLRSRGASLRQMLGLYATEGVAIGLVAVAAGPFLAVLIIQALGYTSTFDPVTGGQSIDTTFVGSAWGLAAGGAVFAVVAILVPVAWVSRGAATEQRRRAARPSGRNVIQRYYLDVAFVLIAVGLIFEADLRGSAFERNSVGGLSSDPLVLITPTLFALAFAVALLRVLPWILGAVTFVVRNYVNVALAGALQHTVRNPGPALRLTLLLMLGAALGTFAASYGGTVDRSFDERVRYAAGVDLRAELGSFGNRPPNDVSARLEGVPGVEEASPVFRQKLTTAQTGGGSGAVTMLAFDPRIARERLWFRDDLAPVSLPDLMREISAPDVGLGIRLPDDPGVIRLWALPTSRRDDMTVWLRVRDARNRYAQVRMGSLDIEGEWQQLEGDLAGALASVRGEPPYSLHAVYLTETFGGTFGDPGYILFDDLTVTTAEGDEVLLEDFEAPTLRWQRIDLRTDRVDQVARFTTEDAISGDSTLQFTWSLGSAIGRRGFYLRDPVLCPGTSSCRLPIIASSSFLEERNLEVGAPTSLRVQDIIMPAFIVGETEFFPTLEPDEGGFLLANLEHFYYFAAIQDFEPPVRPTEAWMLAPDDPAVRETVVDTLLRRPYQLTGFVDRQAMLASEGSDPLTAAGGSGILLVSFIAVGGLIALAFLVTVYITARRRMVEMAVLRTLGVSSRQILAQLTFEYVLIVAIGLVLGTVLGSQVTRLMLSFLEVTELGQPVRPPFVIDTDWAVVAASYGGLTAIFTLGVLGAWRFFAQLSLNRVLRLTE